MSDARLPTALWVAAHVRQCASQNVPVYILRKGAADSGTVMLKIVMKDKTCIVLNQSRGIDGNMGWMNIFGGVADEKKADDYIHRSIARDADLWVIEVEDDTGKNPFEGKVY